MTEDERDPQQEEAEARQRLGEAQADANETLEEAERLEEEAPRLENWLKNQSKCELPHTLRVGDAPHCTAVDQLWPGLPSNQGAENV